MSPLSPISNLDNLRAEISLLNKELFSLLDKRQNACHQIQEQKALEGIHSAYDPKREFEIFEHFSVAIKNLSLKELTAFSLIMEAHAEGRKPQSYPQWSKKVHLQKMHEDELFHLINPLLLKAKSPELFNQLNLSSDFIFLKDFSFSKF